MADYVTKIRTESGDKQIDYNALANKPTVSTLGAAPVEHRHTADELDVNIPKKISDLENDIGFITTDGNTTYTLTKNGSTITLTSSDGSEISIEDSDTTYTLESFGVTVNAEQINRVNGLEDDIKTLLDGKAALSHTHKASEIISESTSETLSSNVLPIVPIKKGGTSATDGATGLKNLFAAGATVLTEGKSYQYGTALPTAGTKGRIFFKKV